MKKLQWAILALSLLVLVGCGKQDGISKAAQTVIETAMTAPNDKLANQDMITMLGLGTSMTQADKDKVAAATAAALEQWDKAIGKYFADKALERFISSGRAGQYLFMTVVDDSGTPAVAKSVTVKDMVLESKDDTMETVLVTLLVDEQEQQAQVSLQYDKQGLITKAYITQVD